MSKSRTLGTFESDAQSQNGHGGEKEENKIEGQSKKGEQSKMMREGLTLNRFTEEEIKVIF